MSTRLVTRRVETPLGPMLAGTAVGDHNGLCLLEFATRRALPTELRDLPRLLGASPPEPEAPGECVGTLDQIEHELGAYFAGVLQGFTVPLVTPGTPFQQRVWNELRRIEHGRAISYGELARRVGSPGGARAVGRANGANRIAIVVPCHRVVDADGGLHGYGGGLENKRKLLVLEGHGRYARTEATLFGAT